LGLTDNLNYGNPHDPEIFWQLREGVEGMAEACRFFDLPVTGGNVSLYNQSPAGPIHPTPVVGVVGKVEEGVRLVGGVLGQGGGAILLLGTQESGGLGASLYLQEIHEILAGKLGKVDLEGEKKLHGLMRGVLKLAGVRAVHDVGEGGILWAVTEMVMGEGSAGAEVTIPSGQGEREEEALFGEGAGRILVEVEEGSVGEVERLAAEAGVGCRRLGVSGGTELKIVCGAVKEKWGVGELQKLFHGSLPKALESE
jgi:phosphoribosylformylglycinamidine synthase